MRPRRILLVAGFSACHAAVLACGHETFDLLPDAGLGDDASGFGGSAGSDARASLPDAASDGQAGANYDASTNSCGDAGCGDATLCPVGSFTSNCQRLPSGCPMRPELCFACGPNFECPEDLRCDRVTLRCLPACNSDGDCGDSRLVCDTERGVCARCASDADCQDDRNQPICFVGECVQCSLDMHCTDPRRPVCEPRVLLCRECFDNRHCPSGMHCEQNVCRNDRPPGDAGPDTGAGGAAGAGGADDPGTMGAASGPNL